MIEMRVKNKGSYRALFRQITNLKELGVEIIPDNECLLSLYKELYPKDKDTDRYRVVSAIISSKKMPEPMEGAMDFLRKVYRAADKEENWGKYSEMGYPSKRLLDDTVGEIALNNLDITKISPLFLEFKDTASLVLHYALQRERLEDFYDADIRGWLAKHLSAKDACYTESFVTYFASVSLYDPVRLEKNIYIDTDVLKTRLHYIQSHADELDITKDETFDLAVRLKNVSMTELEKGGVKRLKGSLKLEREASEGILDLEY
jgi:hypothetical protein